MPPRPPHPHPDPDHYCTDTSCTPCSYYREFIPTKRAAAIYLITDWCVSAIRTESNDIVEDLRALHSALLLVGITNEEIIETVLINQADT